MPAESLALLQAARSRPPRAATPLRLAVADPPYPGLAKRYYAGHPDYAGEVDHRQLLRRLGAYDGWALCTSSSGLLEVLALVSKLGLTGVRVASWHRGARGGRGSGWEPVVYRPARGDPPAGETDGLVYFVLNRRAGAVKIGSTKDETSLQKRLWTHQTGSPDELELLGFVPAAPGMEFGLHRKFDDLRTRQKSEWFRYTEDVEGFIDYLLACPPGRTTDAFAYVSRPRLSDPDRVIGAKPAAFCFWLFRLLGAQAGDELEDLFPGSGGVARAWKHFTAEVSVRT